MYTFHKTPRFASKPVIFTDDLRDNIVYTALEAAYVRAQRHRVVYDHAPRGLNEMSFHVGLGRRMGHTTAITQLFFDNADTSVLVCTTGSMKSYVIGMLSQMLRDKFPKERVFLEDPEAVDFMVRDAMRRVRHRIMTVHEFTQHNWWRGIHDVKNVMIDSFSYLKDTDQQSVVDTLDTLKAHRCLNYAFLVQ